MNMLSESLVRSFSHILLPYSKKSDFLSFMINEVSFYKIHKRNFLKAMFLCF